jgi:hypothetical protein
VGICTLAWAKPMFPGANPENSTAAGCPPTVAVVDASVLQRYSDEAGAPVRTTSSTGPWPVKYTDTTLPAAAGVAAEFLEPSWLTAAARLPPMRIAGLLL